MIGFGEQRNLEITSLSDERLMLIDTMKAGFYDNVLGFKSEDDRIQKFVKDIRKAREIGVAPFYKLVIDPSLEGDNVVYKKGLKPAVGHSYNWWVEAAKDMTPVEDRKWQICTEHQYMALLAFLINRAVETAWDIKVAIEAVVLDSRKLGHYRNSNRAKGAFELTGSREIFGIFDLGNTCKILSCSNGDGFWVAGGNYNFYSFEYPLADLLHRKCVVIDYDSSVAELVLA